jgi:DNA topoisomerase-2
VEDIYQKKSQLEHILLRPDTYVGSIEKQTQQVWVQEGTGVTFKQVTYTPALYKIFDEIIVNAIDNKVRPRSTSHTHIQLQRVTRGPEARSSRRARGLPNGVHAAWHLDGVTLCSRSTGR